MLSNFEDSFVGILSWRLEIVPSLTTPTSCQDITIESTLNLIPSMTLRIGIQSLGSQDQGLQ